VRCEHSENGANRLRGDVREDIPPRPTVHRRRELRGRVPFAESAYINLANDDPMNVDPGLVADVMSKSAPNFKPTPSSPALSTGATPPSDGFFGANLVPVASRAHRSSYLTWSQHDTSCRSMVGAQSIL
jgi:hypothetical protein